MNEERTENITPCRIWHILLFNPCFADFLLRKHAALIVSDPFDNKRDDDGAVSPPDAVLHHSRFGAFVRLCVKRIATHPTTPSLSATNTFEIPMKKLVQLFIAYLSGNHSSDRTALLSRFGVLPSVRLLTAADEQGLNNQRPPQPDALVSETNSKKVRTTHGAPPVVVTISIVSASTHRAAEEQRRSTTFANEQQKQVADTATETATASLGMFSIVRRSDESSTSFLFHVRLTTNSPFNQPNTTRATPPAKKYERTSPRKKERQTTTKRNRPWKPCGWSSIPPRERSASSESSEEESDAPGSSRSSDDGDDQHRQCSNEKTRQEKQKKTPSKLPMTATQRPVHIAINDAACLVENAVGAALASADGTTLPSCGTSLSEVLQTLAQTLPCEYTFRSTDPNALVPSTKIPLLFSLPPPLIHSVLSDYIVVRRPPLGAVPVSPDLSVHLGFRPMPLSYPLLSASTGTTASMFVVRVLYEHYPELLCTLRPYQLAAVVRAVTPSVGGSRGRLLIADDMGLGKTLQAVAIVATLHLLCSVADPPPVRFGGSTALSHPPPPAPSPFPVLIICPAAVRGMWCDEATKWFGRFFPPAPWAGPKATAPRTEALCVTGHAAKLAADISDTPSVVVITRQLLPTLFSADFSRRHWGTVILDESHTLHTTVTGEDGGRPCFTTQCISHLVKAAPHAILLSGTPAIDTPFDMYYQLEALQPALFQRCPKEDFGFSFAEVLISHSGGGFLRYGACSRLEEFKSMLDAFFWIRRTKTDPGVEGALSIGAILQRQRLLRDGLPSIPSSAMHLDPGSGPLETPLRKRIVVCLSIGNVSESPEPCPEESVMEGLDDSVGEAEREDNKDHNALFASSAASVQHQCGMLKAPLVAQFVLRMRRGQEATSDRRVVVFAHHVRVLHVIATTLRTADPLVRVAVIEGATSLPLRERILDEFACGAIAVLIVGVTACGVGVNQLASAPVAVFAELPPNVSWLVQAEARLVRPSTSSPALHPTQISAVASLSPSPPAAVKIFVCVATDSATDRRQWERLQQGYTAVARITASNNAETETGPSTGAALNAAIFTLVSDPAANHTIVPMSDTLLFIRGLWRAIVPLLARGPVLGLRHTARATIEAFVTTLEDDQEGDDEDNGAAAPTVHWAACTAESTCERILAGGIAGIRSIATRLADASVFTHEVEQFSKCVLEALTVLLRLVGNAPLSNSVDTSQHTNISKVPRRHTDKGPEQESMTPLQRREAARAGAILVWAPVLVSTVDEDDNAHDDNEPHTTVPANQTCGPLRLSGAWEPPSPSPITAPRERPSRYITYGHSTHAESEGQALSTRQLLFSLAIPTMNRGNYGREKPNTATAVLASRRTLHEACAVPVNDGNSASDWTILCLHCRTAATHTRLSAAACEEMLAATATAATLASSCDNHLSQSTCRQPPHAVIEWGSPTISLVGATSQPSVKVLQGSPQTTTPYLHLFCTGACRVEYFVRRSSHAIRRALATLDGSRCNHCHLDGQGLLAALQAATVTANAPNENESSASLLLQEARISLLYDWQPQFRRFPRLAEKLAKHPIAGHLWHGDHVVPVAQGGGSCGLDNIQTLCVVCHALKTVQEAKQRKGISK